MIAPNWIWMPVNIEVRFPGAPTNVVIHYRIYHVVGDYITILAN